MLKNTKTSSNAIGMRNCRACFNVSNGVNYLRFQLCSFQRKSYLSTKNQYCEAMPRNSTRLLCSEALLKPLGVNIKVSKATIARNISNFQFQSQHSSLDCFYFFAEQYRKKRRFVYFLSLLGQRSFWGHFSGTQKMSTPTVTKLKITGDAGNCGL